MYIINICTKINGDIHSYCVFVSEPKSRGCYGYFLEYICLYTWKNVPVLYIEVLKLPPVPGPIVWSYLFIGTIYRADDKLQLTNTAA